MNCGHPPPLLLRGSGDQFVVERFDSTSTVIGLFSRRECRVVEKQFVGGDVLIMYSDGVTEAENGEKGKNTDLPLAQIGIALFSPKEAHRCLILNILRAIHDIHDLPLGANSVTGSNVIDNRLKVVRLRVAFY